MKELTAIEASKYSWCDAELLGIAWGNEGRDLIIKWKKHRNSIETLTCTWVHSITFNLQTSENEGGYPLTYEAKINEGEVNGWQVLFDFANRGLIEFKCNDLTLEG